MIRECQLRRTSNFRPTSSAGLLLLASLLGLSGTSLRAQTPPPDGSLDRQIDEAFQRVLKAPADASAGNSYATLLVKAGNYEGAIAALERQLLDPQAPPTARMELAVLYYRLGSYAMSESFAAPDTGRYKTHRRPEATSRRQPPARCRVPQPDVAMERFGHAGPALANQPFPRVPAVIWSIRQAPWSRCPSNSSPNPIRTCKPCCAWTIATTLVCKTRLRWSARWWHRPSTSVHRLDTSCRLPR